MSVTTARADAQPPRAGGRHPPHRLGPVALAVARVRRRHGHLRPARRDRCRPRRRGARQPARQARRGDAGGRARRRAALADRPAARSSSASPATPEPAPRRWRRRAAPAIRSDEAAAAAEEIARRVRSTYAPGADAGHAARGGAALPRRAPPRAAPPRGLERGRSPPACAGPPRRSPRRSRAPTRSRRPSVAPRSTSSPACPNRRYFDEVLSMERPRRRANDSLGILMIDIDHFKLLNDRFGHATGDRVLRAVAGAIAAGRPRRGHAGPLRRRGVRGAPAAHVGGAGHRGRRAHPPGGRAPPPGQPGHRRAGHRLGRAWPWRAPTQVAIPGLVERADQALYRAKRLGRDRVVAA